MTADVTIRFSHVDAAGIVFYPRYFELLSRAFAGVPWTNPPVAFQTEFLRPNRLGDRLSIRDERDDHGWSYTGSLNGDDHFRVASIAETDSVDVDTSAPIIATEPDVVRSLATDSSGHMQLSRYFELVSDTVELWFEALAGQTFSELHIGGGIGIPTVRFTTRVTELPRLGDEVSLHMQAIKVGNKSLTFRSWLMRDGDCLIQNDQIIVFVMIQEQGFTSISIPGDLRARMQDEIDVAT